MSLPDRLHDALADRLNMTLDAAVPVSGGSIAQASRLEADEGSFFLKWGDETVARTFPGECAGLETLASADHPLHIPYGITTASRRDQRPCVL